MIYISGYLYPQEQESGYQVNEKYLSVLSCGFQKSLTHELVHKRPKGRLDFQLIYLAKGSGLFSQNGIEQRVKEGSLVVYKPDEPQFYTYSPNDHPEVYWVHFSGYGVQEILEKAGLYHSFIMSPGFDTIVISLYKQIISELQLQGFLFDEAANSHFHQLIIRLGRLCRQDRSNVHLETSQMVIRTIEKLNANYNENFCVNEEAKRNNTSSCRFILNFRKVTELSPLQYLINIRMEKAKELLLSTSLDIGGIAAIVGYDNPLYFSRLFKKAAGTSPSNFRKNR